jgi:hypothetical protein
MLILRGSSSPSCWRLVGSNLAGIGILSADHRYGECQPPRHGARLRSDRSRQHSDLRQVGLPSGGLCGA